MPSMSWRRKRAQVFALLDLRVEGHHVRNEHVFVTWKSCELPKAQVQITLKEVDAGRFRVTVKVADPGIRPVGKKSD
jgi:hypothetical protein